MQSSRVEKHTHKRLYCVRCDKYGTMPASTTAGEVAWLRKQTTCPICNLRPYPLGYTAYDYLIREEPKRDD